MADETFASILATAEESEAEQQRTNHEQLQVMVLSAIVVGDEKDYKTRIVAAMSRLEDQFFTGHYRRMWTMLVRFHSATGNKASTEEFNELLASTTQLSLAEQVSQAELYKELISREPITEASFYFTMQRLAERWRDNEFDQALVVAQQIHSSSAAVGDQTLAGFTDAASFLGDRIAEIQLSVGRDDMENELSRELQQVVDDYNAAKRGDLIGIHTGFPELDAPTHGAHPGELWLIAGFTGEGKSQTVYNIAWEAWTTGKNVVFGSAEAGWRSVRTHFISRHSLHPKFGRDHGLKFLDILWGTLPDVDKPFLAEVLNDIATCQDYGRLFRFQIPDKASIDYVKTKLIQRKRLGRVDLLVVDYLGLLTSPVRRTTEREELNEVLKSAKRIANYEDLPIISPWQLSREAWQNAQKTKRYTKASLSDTSQAEKSADLILSLLKSDEKPNTVVAQILKNRDGEEGATFELSTNFAVSQVTSSGVQVANTIWSKT